MQYSLATQPQARRKLRLTRRSLWPWLLLAPAFALMLFAFVVPLVVFFKYSFLTFKDGVLYDTYSLSAYRQFLTDPYYHKIVWQTLRMATEVTVVSLIVGYPMAYALWKIQNPGWKKWIAIIIFSPLVVSVVVRSYGFMVLLDEHGPLNYVLEQLHIIKTPLQLVYNQTGVIISLVNVFLPFVVFPMYGAMNRIDGSLKEAAQDLGAGWATTFRRVTLPLTLPGVVAAAEICFTLALGSFVTPAMLGGGRVSMLPLTIYNDTSDINWPIAAVGGMVLLIISLVAVWIFNRLLRYSEVA